MYILLIFHDQQCSILNAMWLYDTITDVIRHTKGVIKYGDTNKKRRIYKTAKSFFKLLKINNDDANLYFK
jgi:hypothetical protein